MGKVKVILIVSIVLTICLAAFVLSIRAKIPSNIFCFLDIGTYRIPPGSSEVNSSNIYGQSFVPNFDGLFMMSIFIPAQNLNSDKELYFHLKENKDDEKDLVTLKWKFKDLHFKENNFYLVPPDREVTEKGFHFHFLFQPIMDSENKEFYCYFEAPKAKAGEGIKLGIWDDITYYEALTKGTMFINHRPHKGYLAFRTYNTLRGSPKTVFNDMCTRFFSDRPFAIFYSCLIAVTFLGLLTAGLLGRMKR